MAQLVLEVDNDKITNFVDLLEAAVTAAKLLPEYTPKTERKEESGGKSYPKKEWKETIAELPVKLEKASGDNAASNAQCGAAYGILKGYGITSKEDQHKALATVVDGEAPANCYELTKYTKGSVSVLISALKQNPQKVQGKEAF